MSVVNVRGCCSICGSHKLETIIDLPDLPLTGFFSRIPMKEKIRGYDQQLLACPECGHGLLARQIPSDIIYNNYNYRTSFSATGRDGTGGFIATLDKIAGKRKFNVILDIGCNDLYLLKQLKDRGNIRVGIDPIWASREDKIDDKSIIVSGTSVEDMDFASILKTPPDLVVCRHVLEHIYEPKVVLQKLIDIAADDALFVFEVPSFEELVRRLRFDQVFHQHLQYFTFNSFQRLLEEAGAELICCQANYLNWAALTIGFVKKNHRSRIFPSTDMFFITIPEILSQYAIFKSQMSLIDKTLESLKRNKIYGYGAAQILPILAYHLKNDLSILKSVFDDDLAKNGYYYSNLPLKITPPCNFKEYEDISIFITAVDNVKSILKKLLVYPPRHIIYPFNII